MGKGIKLLGVRLGGPYRLIPAIVRVYIEHSTQRTNGPRGRGEAVDNTPGDSICRRPRAPWIVLGHGTAAQRRHATVRRCGARLTIPPPAAGCQYTARVVTVIWVLRNFFFF